MMTILRLIAASVSLLALERFYSNWTVGRYLPSGLQSIEIFEAVSLWVKSGHSVVLQASGCFRPEADADS
jgi:hypothetical protein